MSESDSDLDQLPSRLRPVLLPAILPGIDDSNSQTDEGTDDDSSDTPIVFSGINWSAADAKQNTSPLGGQQQQPRQSAVSPRQHPATEQTSAIGRGVDTEDVKLEGLQDAADDEQSSVQGSDSTGSHCSNEESEEEEGTPGMGSGWLSGAAGRLADLSTPRNRNHLKGRCQVGQARDDGPHSHSQDGVSPRQQLQAVREQEEELSRDFHAIVSSSEAEQVHSESNLVLESVVAGLGMSDLDALISRLQAGGAPLDLAATRPADLPDPSTLFSDDEGESPLISRRRPAPAMGSPRGHTQHSSTTPTRHAGKEAAEGGRQGAIQGATTTAGRTPTSTSKRLQLSAEDSETITLTSGAAAGIGNHVRPPAQPCPPVPSPRARPAKAAAAAVDAMATALGFGTATTAQASQDPITVDCSTGTAQLVAATLAAAPAVQPCLKPPAVVVNGTAPPPLPPRFRAFAPGQPPLVAPLPSHSNGNGMAPTAVSSLTQSAAASMVASAATAAATPLQPAEQVAVRVKATSIAGPLQNGSNAGGGGDGSQAPAAAGRATVVVDLRTSIADTLSKAAQAKQLAERKRAAAAARARALHRAGAGGTGDTGAGQDSREGDSDDSSAASSTGSESEGEGQGGGWAAARREAKARSPGPVQSVAKLGSLEKPTATSPAIAARVLPPTSLVNVPGLGAGGKVPTRPETHSVAVGGDDHVLGAGHTPGLEDPGVITGVRRTMFVSTADLDLESDLDLMPALTPSDNTLDQRPGHPRQQSGSSKTTSTFAGCVQLQDDSDEAESSSSSDDDVSAQSHTTGGGHKYIAARGSSKVVTAACSPEGLEVEGSATAVVRIQAKPASQQQQSTSQKQVATASGGVQTSPAAADVIRPVTAGTTSSAAVSNTATEPQAPPPQTATVMMDTELDQCDVDHMELGITSHGAGGHTYGAPSGAPGMPFEKGTKVVQAGTRIVVPRGDPVVVPSQQESLTIQTVGMTAETQTDTAALSDQDQVDVHKTVTAAAAPATAVGSCQSATGANSARAPTASLASAPATTSITASHAPPASSSPRPSQPSVPAATSAVILAKPALNKDAAARAPATPHQQPATSHQQPATSHQQPATSHQQPATSHQQPAAHVQAALVAPAALSFPQLPPWCPPSACFTVAFTAPDNLRTHTAAALSSWLVAQQQQQPPARVSQGGSGSHTITHLTHHRSVTTPITVASLTLVALPLNHPVIWRMQSADALQHVATASSSTSGSVSSGGKTNASDARSGSVRVLVAAVLPGTWNRDRSQAADASVSEGEMQKCVRSMESALESVTFADILSSHGLTIAAPPFGGPLPQSQTQHLGPAATSKVSSWATVVEGADLFAATTAIPTGATNQGSSSAAGSTVSSGTSNSTVSSTGHTSETLVCTISSGALSQPQVLLTVLGRAAEVGLTLRALRTLYLPEETSSYLAGRTPHHPAPFVGCVALALCGAEDALGRWRAQLGPGDREVARAAEPHSLHALLPGVEPRLLASSYDARGAAAELGMLFSGVLPASSGAAHGAAVGTPGGTASSDSNNNSGSSYNSSSSTASSASNAQAASREKGASSLDSYSKGPISLPPPAAPQQETQWLGLPAGDAHHLVSALWACHHLAWAGFGINSLLLLTSLPQGADGQQQQQQPCLVVEVSKQEARTQVGSVLGGLHPLRHTALPVSVVSTETDAHNSSITTNPSTRSSMSGHRMSISGSRASLQKVIGLQQAEEQAVLAAVIAGAGGAAGMPGQGVADELLSTVANTSSRSISSSSADRSAEDDTSDQLVAVAIQSKQAAEALLLLLELVRCTAVLPTASSTTAGAGTTGATPAPPAVELVAVRQLRSVPGHVRERITDVRSITAGAAASSTAQSSGRASASASAGAGAVKAQLAAGAPTLLAVLHGPDVASVISAACESWASLFSHSHMPAGSHLHRTTQPNPSGFNQRGVGPQAAEESSEGSVQLSLAAAMGPESVAQYAGVGAYRAPLVLGVSATQSDARHVLAACFHQGSQVRLDPSFHSGALRPALSNAPPAGAEGHADMSALCSAQAIHRLLSGPHPFSTVVSVVVGHQQQLGGGGSRAPHLSVLPRLIKLLWREGFVVRAAHMLEPSTSDAALLGLSPALPSHSAASTAGKSEKSSHTSAVVTLWVWRTNAHMAMQRLVDGLAVTGSSSTTSSTGHTFAPAVTLPASVADAERAIASLWPDAASPEGLVAQLQAAAVTTTGLKTAPTPSQQSMSTSSASDPVQGCLLVSAAGGSPAAGSSTPKVVRSASAGLLQATCLLVLPAPQQQQLSQGGSSNGGRVARQGGPQQQQPAVGVDWGLVSEVLGAVRADGFSLGGMTALRIAPSHVPTLARAAKLTAAQSAALTAAANSSPAANVVALALVRDNAVSHLHLRVQQAAAGAASASSTRSMGLGSSTSGIGGTAFGWVLPAGSTSAIVVPGTNAAAEHLVVALFSQLHCPPPGGQLSIAT